MNVLTARAKRVDNGEWVVGYPCQGIERLFMYETSKYFDYPVVVDPATLNYATGKPDCHGEMIYGGMILKVGMFGGRVFLVLWSDTLMQWILASRSGDPVVWLVDVNSSDLEIVKGGE